MRITLLIAGVAALTALPGVAAADEIASGAIVKIEDRELYLNLGEGVGVEAGAPLRVKRPVKLKHPVTGALVEDWVPIGSAKLTAVGGRLSMAIVDADLVNQIRVGDVAEVYVVRAATALPPTPVPTTPPKQPDPTPDEPLPSVDPDTAEVLALWESTTGAALDARVAAWESYLARRPDSRFAEAIREDLEILRTQREAVRPLELSLEGPPIRGVDHRAPTRAEAGAAVPLVFVLSDPQAVASGWLHYRTSGQPSYRRALLRREGDFYLRGELPADAVVAPGAQYFVEVTTPAGDVGTAVGSPDRPMELSVENPPLTARFTEQRRRSRVSLITTYLDFATFDARDGDRRDTFTVTEADMLYRIDSLVYGVRAGFGSIQGRGGRADVVWDDANPAPKAGFNYGYAEVELRGKRNVGGSVRVVAGVGQDGFGMGVEGRLRLGHPDRTNLSLAAQTVSELGFLSEMRLQLDAVKKLPIGLAVAITDQPIEGDTGVRLSTDVAWRVTDWLQPMLRVSYQGRTVQHSGVGVGGGLIFDW